MLAQFQARYPTGSLISELLTIYQGKFIVRVSVQIDGLTRATGIAAAETPELAEDTARNRAIAVMAIDSSTTILQDAPKPSSGAMLQSAIKTTFAASEPTRQINQNLPLSVTQKLNDLDFADSSPPQQFKPELAVLSEKDKKSDRLTSTPISTQTDNFFQDESISSTTTKSSSNTEISPNVTPLTPPTYAQANASFAPKQVSEPIDLSDVLAKTDIELERLRWSKEQGKDYLIRTYNKRGRSLLTDQELLEFLQYLESQPTPNQLT